MEHDAILHFFKEKFETTPSLYRSPGRVNLIGEHTDYNNGFVLPAAINKAVHAAISLRNDNEFRWYAYDFNDYYEGSATAVHPSKAGWPNYILGVVAQLQRAGYKIGGFDMVVASDVPVGAGLSSSAAMECVIAFALNDLLDLKIDKLSLVKMAQKAEHEFAGVQCGIMDQFASMMGKKGQVIQLDCRSLAYEYLPFAFDDIEIVLFDSMVKHSLASSEYNTRRKECEQGVALIKQKHPEVESLRDITSHMVHTLLNDQEKIYDRCLYVVEEIERLLLGCEDLQRGDLAAFGKKMYATHDGLSKLYEVSCAELDFLVECAEKESAILGARMMGGGFGGCTINLVMKSELEAVSKRISQQYFERFNIYPDVHRAVIDEGASKII